MAERQGAASFSELVRASRAESWCWLEGASSLSEMTYLPSRARVTLLTALAMAPWPGCGNEAGKHQEACGEVGQACCERWQCEGELVCREMVCYEHEERALGEECEGSEDCESWYCVETGEGSVCSQRCDGEDGWCRNGWTCEERVDEGVSVCECEATEESCDGLDNDCNGTVDDAAAVDPLCDQEMSGAICTTDHECACPIGIEVCDGACLDLTTDREHCGSCDAACGEGFVCAGSECVLPSCAANLRCRDESCCVSLEVPGGSFPMGRSEDGTDAYDEPLVPERELPEHEVTVSGFWLDKYEVTVGRMRAFVEAYDAWHGVGHPEAGDGEHPRIPGSGWQVDWPLPEGSGALKQALRSGLIGAPDDIKWDELWSNAPAGREDYPINCVDWYVAFAFCIWDGGRLPTEAEWEYAAAGGDENRLYPWASDSSTGRATRGCGSEESLQDCMVPVGSSPEGDGRYGHADLAGSIGEWVFDVFDEDWYSTGGQGCIDCACLAPADGDRVFRGGSVSGGDLRAAYRGGWGPDADGTSFGFRCAR